METRTTAFRKWIKEANEDEYRLFMIDKIYENKVAVTGQYDNLAEQQNDFRKEHKKEHTCMIGNGKKREVPLNEAVGLLADRSEVMHYEIKDIKAYTTVLKDFNSLGTIIKRHKWLFSGISLGMLSTLIKIWIG